MPVKVIEPGGTIGVLGSGQLGRMLGYAARRLGYRFHVFSPGRDTPAGQIADREISAPYDDLDAVAEFARGVDVVTYEFENVPAATAEAAAAHAPLHPGPQALYVAQNRLREKTFFRDHGLPVTAFAPVSTAAELADAVAAVGCPAILKTATSGYDGKGQVSVDRAEDAVSAWEAMGRQPAIWEKRVAFEREVSVVAARGAGSAGSAGGGSFAHFGVIENDHANHILDLSVAPAPVPDRVRDEAVALAHAVLEALDVIGVLCVEFFLTADDRLLLNEMAPRPHNSGHLTIEACVTSQFEQQLRAVCGLPLGDTRIVQPAAMANLLGDLWAAGPPPWQSLLAFPAVKLHLYGKTEPRPGRKMGHLTVLAAGVSAAEREIRAARAALTPQPTNHFP